MKPNVRRQSRSLAVQGIYSWQVSKNRIGDIEAWFHPGKRFLEKNLRLAAAIIHYYGYFPDPRNPDGGCGE